jgi:hypothetical protein
MFNNLAFTSFADMQSPLANADASPTSLARMLHSALNAALVPLLLFCAITLLFSALTGAFFLSSPLSVLVGLLGTWFLCTRFPVSIEIPAIVWVLTVLLLALLLYPILLRGGVDGSADAVSAIATRLMDSKIPATYAPYSDIAYNYQIGFPLLARAVNDFLFFIPDHQIVWMLGALFSALLIPLVYWFCRAFNGSADTALVAAVLVFGTKLVFQDFYYGEYAWALATVLYLCALILWKKRNPLFLLLIPAILTVHPAIALNFLFFAAVLLVFGWLPLEFLVPAVLSGMLALPAFFYTYLPLLKNIAGGAGRDPFSLSSALNNVALVPPWIGTGLSIAFGIAFVLVVWRKRTTPRLPVWPLFIAAFALVLFGLFSGLGNVLPGRIIERVQQVAGGPVRRFARETAAPHPRGDGRRPDQRHDPTRSAPVGRRDGGCHVPADTDRRHEAKQPQDGASRRQGRRETGSRGRGQPRDSLSLRSARWGSLGRDRLIPGRPHERHDDDHRTWKSDRGRH